MSTEQAASVRAARRADVPALVDLRIQHLGELAHQEPGVKMLPDARARTEQAMPVWLGQEERAVLVAEVADGGIAGYAMGTVGTLPPVLKNQHVGEILECFVLPAARGQGHGRALIAKLTEILVGRGAQVLRAAIPVGNDAGRRRLASLGYEPIFCVMRRNLEAG